MKHHLTETHEHNFEIHNIVLSSQLWVTKYLFKTQEKNEEEMIFHE